MEERSTQLEAAKQEAASLTLDLTTQSDAILVATDADVAKATDVLQRIAEATKKLESQRTFLVKPLNDHVKTINAQFKEWTTPLEKLGTALRGKILEYRQKQAALAADEQRRLEEATRKRQEALDKKAEKKGIEAPTLVVPQVAPPPKVTGLSTRKVWKFQVTDEPKVPREFLTVDEAKIRQAVTVGTREIAGVRIYEEETVVIR